MSTLKQKAVTGGLWNFIENGASQLLAFVATIILARILTPHDFGLIGMTVVITALAQVLIDSGFSQALIRKHICSVSDYNTVFYLNVGIGLFLYLFIFVISPLFAQFYGVTELTQIIRVISLSIPLNSLTLIHKTIFLKNYELKKHSIISIISVTIAFVFAIVLAKNGFGVWSLVYRSIVQQFVSFLLFSIISSWRPSFDFSIISLKELFNFGSKLVIISTISIIFKNTLNMIIGKLYGTSNLGYYTNADQMSGLPAGILTTMYNKVAFPILVELHSNNEKIKPIIQRVNKPLVILSFIILVYLAAISDSLIPMLFGVDWAESAVYFRILCFGYMAGILQTINQVILNIKGRSDLFLKTEIIKYLFFIPVIILGLIFNVKIFLIAFSVHYWLGFIVNGLYSGSLVGYGVVDQIKDIFKPLFFSIILFFATIIPKYFVSEVPFFYQFVIQTVFCFLFASIMLSLEPFREYKTMISDLIRLFLKKKL